MGIVQKRDWKWCHTGATSYVILRNWNLVWNITSSVYRKLGRKYKSSLCRAENCRPDKDKRYSSTGSRFYITYHEDLGNKKQKQDPIGKLKVINGVHHTVICIIVYCSNWENPVGFKMMPKTLVAFRCEVQKDSVCIYTRVCVFVFVYWHKRLW